VSGRNYTFVVSAENHPFWIKTARGTGKTNGYPGVSVQGVEIGTTVLTIPLVGFPTVLYYNCQYHRAMEGDLLITSSVVPSLPTSLAPTVPPPPPFSDKMKLLHAIIMFITMGISLPIGVIIKKYFDFPPSNVGFKIHQIQQPFTILLACGGAGVGIYFADKQYEAIPHAYLGTFLLSLCVIQVFIGIFRPHKVPNASTQPMLRLIFETFHIWCGRFIILGTICQIYYGFQYFGSPTWIFGAYGAVLFLFFLLIVLLEFKACYLAQSSTSAGFVQLES